MDKYFVCLANSFKRGGRCVAGIEVIPEKNGKWIIARNQDGSPHWIRPIASTQYGEIPNHIAFNIKLLHVVKLIDVKACPKHAHSENLHYSQLEVYQLFYPSELAILNQFVDTTHQSVFGNRGKAISVEMLLGLSYSLMLIHVKNANAYIDESREKSKNRMRFSYFGTEYDFPITDPIFLDEFRKQPERFVNIPDVFLTLSLGLEFEGWHHKLVAGVILHNGSFSSQTVKQEEQSQELQPDWFDEYELELERLLDQKTEIEGKINELRKKLLTKMENCGIDRVQSHQFSVRYTPAKTVMQFDSRAFRTENENLYSYYCRPKQREASITVKRIMDNNT